MAGPVAANSSARESPTEIVGLPRNYIYRDEQEREKRQDDFQSGGFSRPLPNNRFTVSPHYTDAPVHHAVFMNFAHCSLCVVCVRVRVCFF